MRILAIANQKGGVGKTTTTVNLAASLAERGHRALVVDLDPQGNLTSSLALNVEDDDLSVYDAIVDGEPLANVIVATAAPHLLACPADPSLAGADLELAADEPTPERRASRLRRALRALRAAKPDIRYVLLDCPPSLGLLTVNALVAAHAVVIPMQCEFFSMQGLSRLLGTMRRVAGTWNRDLALLGVVFTMVDRRTRLAGEVIEEVRRQLGRQVFETEIPRSIRLAEAPSFGLPITRHAPRSAGATAYGRLAEEVLGR